MQATVNNDMAYGIWRVCVCVCVCVWSRTMRYGTRYTDCRDVTRKLKLTKAASGYESCPESKDTSRVGRLGNFLCLLWQHCRRPWSFTCEPCSFDIGRTGFVWVRRVWNGSADPKSHQMWGAFRHTNETDGFRPEVSHALRTGRRWVSGLHCDWRLKHGLFTTLLKVRRRRWGARRSHDMVQRAGGRLLWLGDTEAGSKT